MKGDTWKVVLTILLIAAAIFYLWPTYQYFTMSDSARETMRTSDPDGFAALQKKALKLGLDLQGGMRVVLEVDKSQLDENAGKDARERALEIIRNRVDEFGVAEPVIQAQGDNRIVVELPALQDPERARNLIGKTALLEFKIVESPENSEMLVKRLDPIAAKIEGGESSTTPADTSANPFVDPFGDTTKTADSANAFADIDDSDATGLSQYISYAGPFYAVAESDFNTVDRILENPSIKAVIPPDVEFAWSTRSELVNGQRIRPLYLLKKKVEMSGTHLTDANPNYDQFHKPVVDFVFDREGGEMFGRVTGPNIGKPLAILLDGKVESAPNIRSKIRDKGQITLGGTATFFDAKDLATILRAGALPAPVKIVENNVIGPTLGKDSIEAGKLGLSVALVLIVVFMLIYYRTSGIIANLVLITNVFFLMAVMAGLGATLTLPGIAGIILTMGLAVDSSVLIFERIRDEVRAGKTVKAAIDAGYSRASVPIIDSNITNLIAAGVLYYFGSGTVKGFAVTLGVGIMVSLYTALVIGKLAFNLRKGAAKLSI
ncbi:MAG: protein translocase subunit SecD [bacterium]|nr:protein translocase subunit SecD [bacterium]